ANLKLVIKVARGFKPNKEVSIMDIIQNGNIGLMKAVEKYEPERELSFSNYACYWIKQSIIRGFQKSKFAGGASFRRIESYKKIINYIVDYKKEKGSIPRMDEIQKATSLSKNIILDVIKTLQENGEYISFSSICETSDVLIENIADNSYNPEFVMEKKFVREEIEKAISLTASGRDRDIIRDRYYLSKNTEKSTLSNLSKKYSLSPEGIRQIEKRIFNYIRLKYPFLISYLY
ncbi:MAG: sigma-70 family RNA polymerase sigma factor, partial [Brevinematia bacterium]